MAHDSGNAPDRMLTRGEIRSEYGIGVATMTLTKWMKRRQFPTRHRLADGSLLWSANEVRAWVQQRVRVLLCAALCVLGLSALARAGDADRELELLALE